MNLEQQIQKLIDDAPQDGDLPLVIKQAIAPVLKLFASRLKHLDYYILQNFSQSWVITTLRAKNSDSATKGKKVIYAFTTAKDATAFQGDSTPEVVAWPIPVTHILFQLFALHQVDSIIFLETPGNLSRGTEVRRSDLQQLIQSQLQEFKTNSGNVPPDIA